MNSNHLCLFVVNKNGSLVYTRTFSNRLNFTNNDTIRLGSTFHSMHAISSQITPSCALPKPQQLEAPVLDGITEIVTDTFVLKSQNTLTGIKIVLVSLPHAASMQPAVLRRVNEAYSDFVAKNPFQEADMPIKSELFDAQICLIFN